MFNIPESIKKELNLQPKTIYVSMNCAMIFCMKRLNVFAVIALAGLIPCNALASNPVEVAPGVSLPTGGDGTVYGLDLKSSGPVLEHIKPHEVLTVSHAGSNFLRSMVYAGPHMSAELDGNHSDTVISSTKAVFFVRLTGDEAEIDRARVHLLWLQPNKKRREITDFSMNVFGGQRSRNVDEVPSNMEMVEGTNWLKLTPNEPLLPGEFAIAFLPKDVNQQPSSVYDFNVPGGRVGQGNPYAPKPGAIPVAAKP